MVAETIELPNLRKMFIPDSGMTIFDCDLARADAQVIAWDAGDEGLKELFRSGKDIHKENACEIFGVEKCTYSQRHRAKQGVHAVNYLVQARTLAEHLLLSVKEAQNFIDSWLGAHPNIKEWHERIAWECQHSRQVKNIFGYRRYIFERIRDKTGKLPISTLQEALAWIPQSTVALITNKGLKNINTNLPEVQILLQVHDSLVMQVPTEKAEEFAHKVLEQMKIVVPYEDPLIIPVGLSTSEKSWGDIKETVVLDGRFYYKSEDNNKPSELVWPEN